MTVNGVYSDHEDKEEDDHKDDHDRKLKLQEYYNECINLLELVRKAWKKRFTCLYRYRD